MACRAPAAVTKDGTPVTETANRTDLVCAACGRPVRLRLGPHRRAHLTHVDTAGRTDGRHPGLGAVHTRVRDRVVAAVNRVRALEVTLLCRRCWQPLSTTARFERCSAVPEHALRPTGARRPLATVDVAVFSDGRRVAAIEVYDTHRVPAAKWDVVTRRFRLQAFELRVQDASAAVDDACVAACNGVDVCLSCAALDNAAT
jgi:hypothetical protein